MFSYLSLGDITANRELIKHIDTDIDTLIIHFLLGLSMEENDS